MYNQTLAARLDAAVAGEDDPDPGGSNSEPLERTLAALFAGRPMPKADMEHLIAPIANCLEELFLLRDQRVS